MQMLVYVPYVWANPNSDLKENNIFFDPFEWFLISHSFYHLKNSTDESGAPKIVFYNSVQMDYIYIYILYEDIYNWQ